MRTAVFIRPPSVAALLLLTASFTWMTAALGGSGSVGGVLAKTAGPGNEVYGVYMMKFEEPSMVSKLRYLLYTKPKAGSVVNRAFLLAPVGSDEQPNLSQVPWVGYRYAGPFVFPPAVFAADLTFDGRRNAFLLATLESRGRSFGLEVHQVRTSASPLVDPRQLDVELLENWPSAPEALGSIWLSLDGPPWCCVGGRLKVVLADDQLIIHVLAEGDDCRGVVLGFSMSGGGWKRLRLRSEDVKSRQ